MESQSALPQISLTQEDIDEARSSGLYRRTDKKGSLRITGYSTNFKNDPTFVYIEQLRICGGQDSVEKCLESNGIEDIQAWFDTAYTKENIKVSEEEGGSKERFDAELKLQKEAKASSGEPKKVSKSIDPARMDYILENVGKMVMISADARKEVPKDETKSAAKKTGVATKAVAKPRKAAVKKEGSVSATAKLLKRISELKPDKVLDVSNIKDDLFGAHTMARPGPTSAKYGISSVAIVSSDPAKLSFTLKALGYSEEDVEACLDEWNTNATTTKPKVAKNPKSKKPAMENKAAPVKFTAPQPTRRVGAAAQPSVPKVNAFQPAQSSQPAQLSQPAPVKATLPVKATSLVAPRLIQRVSPSGTAASALQTAPKLQVRPQPLTTPFQGAVGSPRMGSIKY